MRNEFKDLQLLDKKSPNLINPDRPIYDNDFETIHLFVGILAAMMFILVIGAFMSAKELMDVIIPGVIVYILIAFAFINILFNQKRIRNNQRQIYYTLELLSLKVREEHGGTVKKLPGD